MRPLLLAGAALLSQLTTPTVMRAQTASDSDRAPLPVIAPAGVTSRAAACTYVSCALRVERRFWSGPTLVRGTNGETAADIGSMRAPDVLPLFAVNDSASKYSQQYVRAARVNHPLEFVGIVLGAIGLAQRERGNAYTLAGASLLAISIPFQITEERSLSRAVWWYNASLSGGSAPH